MHLLVCLMVGLPSCFPGAAGLTPSDAVMRMLMYLMVGSRFGHRALQFLRA